MVVVRTTCTFTSNIWSVCTHYSQVWAITAVCTGHNACTFLRVPGASLIPAYSCYTDRVYTSGVSITVTVIIYTTIACNPRVNRTLPIAALNSNTLALSKKTFTPKV